MSWIKIFAKAVDDGEGGLYYLPTAYGYAVIVVCMILALILAAFLIGRKGLVISTKQLAVSAICIAVAFALSNIKLFSFPFGGSVTLMSMFFICLIGYWYGIGAGVLTGVAYGFLQLLCRCYFD